MAFNDLPKIDKASKTNELSERKLEAELNQQTGFICRPDVPDKGCDYDVELILDQTQVSDWRFALQLKSIETPTFVQDNQYLSYAFETSRLGYLINRLPAMGIVVIYSEKQDILYFDYVDKIYQRLMDERETDEWKNNDKVNILIPANRLLNKETVTILHSAFEKRFRSATTMQLSHGAKYDLPTINLSGKFQYDFNNIDHIKKVLKELGMFLLNEHDLQMIFNLVSKVPSVEIYADKDLMMVAAIVYGEVGMHLDSSVYIAKLLKRTDLETRDLTTIRFAQLKNQMALGEIDSDAFIAETRKMKKDGIGMENEICLIINTNFYELLSIKSFHSIPKSLIDSVEDVFKKIELLDSDKQKKWLLEIWNTENYSILVSNFRNKLFSELRLTESFGGQFKQEEKKARVLFLVSLQNRFYSIVDKLDKKAKKLDSELLQAYTFRLYNRFVLSLEIDYTAYEFQMQDGGPTHEKLFINHIHLATTALKIFLDLSYFKEAYQSLCNALELLELSRNKYHYKDEINIQQLLTLKLQMEQELDFMPYKLVIPDLLSSNDNFKGNNDGLPFAKNMDDEELENLARVFLSSRRLPNEQLINIVNEMKAYRLFHNRCRDGSLAIYEIYETGVSEKDHFRAPVKFVLISKKTGIESKPSSDMEELLQGWGY